MIPSELVYKGISDDGKYLLLAENDKNYRLSITSDLKTSLLNTHDEQNTVKISPKEIQKRLRAGLSVTEIIKLTGLSYEIIEKFNAPVELERSYALSNFKKTDIPYNDRIKKIGNVVENYLFENEIKNENWSAYKIDNEPWSIKLEFEFLNKSEVAVWSFDSKTNIIYAKNKNAKTITSAVFFTESTISNPNALKAQEPPKPVILQHEILRKDDEVKGFKKPKKEVVSEPLHKENVNVDITDIPVEKEPPPSKLAKFGKKITGKNAKNVIELQQHMHTESTPQPQDSEENSVQDNNQQSDDQFALFTQDPSVVNNTTPLIKNDTTSLTSEDLRSSKASASNKSKSAPKGSTPPSQLQTSPVIKLSSEKKLDSNSLGDKPADESKKSKKKTRPSLPSWDEIVFGSKQDDE